MKAFYWFYGITQVIAIMLNPMMIIIIPVVIVVIPYLFWLFLKVTGFAGSAPSGAEKHQREP